MCIFMHIFCQCFDFCSSNFIFDNNFKTSMENDIQPWDDLQHLGKKRFYAIQRKWKNPEQQKGTRQESN